ncbi:hypothetical protein GCM10011344_26850 [Dokdonia pacifica]|uniref:Patatin-like phospholipase/acyl hydrolase n=1 Tax=Dokdonia pacifica TaxID=1627892 RepID=A0A239E0S4_9FLAO|nr:CBASS cGAMP-activated phospholipase [Dokdonia pacifica]GGG24813.1 hypothetical protein GCM10011344_26850 [Dokdonia pacifica]SNS37582.1 Patatin-like phospholipase/acyl hydrolase [Dokdonia pacifica]
MIDQKIKILSLDGGGIRGVFPAKILSLIEEEIGEGELHKHFNVICGTSTGGIIALAISLGVPAKEILQLYQENAKTIFGKKRNNIFKKAFYSNKPLEHLIRELFKKYHDGKNDPKIKDAKTKLLIPTYSLLEGSTQIIKTPHKEDLTTDQHIPMYMVAMATSAAPTFFNAYSGSYTKKETDSHSEDFSHKVDGGVFANNPSMIGIVEAQTRLQKDLSQIKMLSLGTGHRKYSQANSKKRWSVFYWIWKKRIIDLFMQSQSQITHNSVSVLSKFNNDFEYRRIDQSFDQNFNVKMDETNPDKLKKFIERSSRIFQTQKQDVLDTYFSNR